MTVRSRLLSLSSLVALGLIGPASSAGGPAERDPVLDRRALLRAETFWDNRDWDWYEANVPFFECPDPAVQTTYYYRWELVTKHLTYGSPASGYSFTEFIDRPFWSGAYGAISCPAGHQLYEVRWLNDPVYARDYSRYWFKTPGAQPRNYSTWLADAVWAVHRVHPDPRTIRDLLPELVKNYEGWEREHFDEAAGLFWQTGHDDGMEYNINSRQTRDIVRGAPGYRPTLNSYLWADALAIARAARLAGDDRTADRFTRKADAIKSLLQKKLWDPRRSFFFPMYRRDEEKDGQTIKAGSLTYQSGPFAGNGHGREEIGFVPWQFNLPDRGYESAWSFLMDPDSFFAPYGPTVTERHDPLFLVTKSCCWWSGQSWPYATTQTLKAMANLLTNYDQKYVTKDDYFKLLKVYTLTQRKDGRPYIAEGANPDTGSWEGYDSYNHSEHYFHSGYNDLIITGLVGLHPSDDDRVEVEPLIPDGWAYCALEGVPYKGHRVAVVWDRDGTRYGLGAGLHLRVDGKTVASSPDLSKLVATLPPAGRDEPDGPRLVNFAVNNDGTAFPRATASYSHESTPIDRVNDGNYWYHKTPPNRWTLQGSPGKSDWVVLDFGIKRPVRSVKLYLLDDGDGEAVRAPSRIDLESWDGKAWVSVPGQSRSPESPTGRRANVIRFPERETSKLRVVFTHEGASRTGLSEFEAWGPLVGAYETPPPPPGNVAYNPRGEGFPAASASYTSRFDRVACLNDGVVNHRPQPANRWTAFESPNPTDWVAVDFGRDERVNRVVLHLYDDRGGVQAPSHYQVQYREGDEWADVKGARLDPPEPVGGRANTVTFEPVKTSRVRVVFTHRQPSRAGLTEIEVWREE